jgi:hypothetical protein
MPYAKVFLDSETETFAQLDADRNKPLVQCFNAMCDICDLASDLTIGDAAAIFKRIHDIAISALDGEYVSANGEN